MALVWLSRASELLVTCLEDQYNARMCIRTADRQAKVMNSRRVCPHCDECLSLKTHLDDKWLHRDLSQDAPADDGSDDVEPYDSPSQSFILYRADFTFQGTLQPVLY